MSRLTDQQLREMAQKARAIAVPVGSLSGWWDSILDAEAILAGKRSLLPRDQIEDIFIREFGQP